MSFKRFIKITTIVLFLTIGILILINQSNAAPCPTDQKCTVKSPCDSTAGSNCSGCQCRYCNSAQHCCCLITPTPGPTSTPNCTTGCGNFAPSGCTGSQCCLLLSGGNCGCTSCTTYQCGGGTGGSGCQPCSYPKTCSGCDCISPTPTPGCAPPGLCGSAPCAANQCCRVLSSYSCSCYDCGPGHCGMYCNPCPSGSSCAPDCSGCVTPTPSPSPTPACGGVPPSCSGACPDGGTCGIFSGPSGTFVCGCPSTPTPTPEPTASPEPTATPACGGTPPCSGPCISPGTCHPVTDDDGTTTCKCVGGPTPTPEPPTPTPGPTPIVSCHCILNAIGNCTGNCTGGCPPGTTCTFIDYIIFGLDKCVCCPGNPECEQADITPFPAARINFDEETQGSSDTGFQIDSAVKCGKTKYPTCSTGKCKDPSKECKSKFSKKKNKWVCKCRPTDEAESEELSEEEDIDEEDESIGE